MTNNNEHVNGNSPSPTTPPTADRGQISASYNVLHDSGYFVSKKQGGFGGTDIGYRNLIHRFIREHNEMLPLRSMLEIGPATGLLMEQVIQNYPNIVSAQAVEYSEKNAADCAARISPLLEKRGGSFRMLNEDYLTAKNKLNPADLVLSCYVAQYTGDIQQYIQDLIDLTNPGGVMLLVDVMTEAQVILPRELWHIIYSHVTHGVLPSLEMFVSFKWLTLYEQPAFKQLDPFHKSYHFNEARWKDVARRYGGEFVKLGAVAGLLKIPKPLT